MSFCRRRGSPPTLTIFADTYGNNRVFDIFGKPLVVLTGTPVMTRATVAKIAEPARKRLFILASDKNIKSYKRIADVVDGNLYYWSSVNPQTHKRLHREVDLIWQCRTRKRRNMGGSCSSRLRRPPSRWHVVNRPHGW